MSTLKVNVISETTLNAGVTVDGVLIKDGKLGDGSAVFGTLGTVTVGDGVNQSGAWQGIAMDATAGVGPVLVLKQAGVHMWEIGLDATAAPAGHLVLAGERAADELSVTDRMAVAKGSYGEVWINAPNTATALPWPAALTMESDLNSLAGIRMNVTLDHAARIMTVIESGASKELFFVDGRVGTSLGVGVGASLAVPAYLQLMNNTITWKLQNATTGALSLLRAAVAISTFTDAGLAVGNDLLAPLARLHVQDTTTPQARISYDADNYMTMTVSLAGAVTLAAAGTGAGFKFGAGKLGFYNTAPVDKQTGVAVTAEGIHAALVNLGLIAA